MGAVGASPCVYIVVYMGSPLKFGFRTLVVIFAPLTLVHVLVAIYVSRIKTPTVSIC